MPLIRYILAAAVVMIALSWWMKDRLPPVSAILPALTQEPAQTAISRPALHLAAKDFTYTVQPLYSYEIVGLIVSVHRSDELFDLYHGRSNDFANIKDLCVVWGENATGGVYRDMNFSSGDFTCYCQTNSSEVWSRFRMNQMSNNHLLPATGAIAKSILSARIGDQVSIRGALCTYDLDGTSYHRGTSITREDDGNGACETIYVEDFQILRRANRIWPAIFAAGWTLAAGAIAAAIFLFVRNFMSGEAHPSPDEEFATR
ncbi:hypothetical protein BH09SUM1_BH09SUM1_18090 [soil metagenome]